MRRRDGVTRASIRLDPVIRNRGLRLLKRNTTRPDQSIQQHFEFVLPISAPPFREALLGLFAVAAATAQVSWPDLRRIRGAPTPAVTLRFGLRPPAETTERPKREQVRAFRASRPPPRPLRGGPLGAVGPRGSPDGYPESLARDRHDPRPPLRSRRRGLPHKYAANAVCPRFYCAAIC